MSFQAFCDSLYHNSIQIMRYETFVINIIIEQKNISENPITYQWYLKINRWYSNKIRCKKMYPNTNHLVPEGDEIILVLVLVWVCANVYYFGLALVCTGLVIQREMGMKGRERVRLGSDPAFAFAFTFLHLFFFFSPCCCALVQGTTATVHMNSSRQLLTFQLFLSVLWSRKQCTGPTNLTFE